MKYRKKQLLSLLLSTAILIGNSAVAAAGFSSDANETVSFSEDSSSENDISLADPEDSFSDSDPTVQEDIFIEAPEITEVPEHTDPEGNPDLLEDSQSIEAFFLRGNGRRTLFLRRRNEHYRKCRLYTGTSYDGRRNSGTAESHGKYACVFSC